MGCFLGCFGGAKEQRRRKQRINRASPQAQRRRVQNVQQESVVTVEQTIRETPPTKLVSESRIKPEAEEKLSPSPRKRVTFNSNVTTYEHVSVHESIDSLPDCNTNTEQEKQLESKQLSHSHSLSEDDNSVISSVGSYPPNHRYHNAIDADDEYEEYGDSDLDDDLDDLDDENYEDYDEDFDDDGITDQEFWSKSVVTSSRESRTGNSSMQELDEEVESHMVNAHMSDEEVKALLGSKTNVRDRSDYVNSVLNPIENVTQWKALKLKGTIPFKPQKENKTANVEAPHVSLSSEPTFRQTSSSFKSKADQVKTPYQEIAVNASLSNWLVSRS